MSAVHLSVTEVALAARCPRQLLLSREGFRLGEADGGIGQTAHAVLAAFVERGQDDQALLSALAGDEEDEAALAHACVEALYRELFDRAPALAPRIASRELLRLSRIVFDLAPLLTELLSRARKSGLRGAGAFRAALRAGERAVTLSLDGGELEICGQLDLLAADALSGEAYVIDLKTSLTDAAAEEQVRLYALALSRAGEKCKPTLAHVNGSTIELRTIELDAAGIEALEGRARQLAEVVEGKKPPPPAPDTATCETCPVQKPCWSRWGRTLREPGEESKPEDAAGSSEIAQEGLKLEKALRAHKVKLERLDPALAVVGPNVVRFRLALREGETIRRVERAARDVQRAMDWPVPPIVRNDGVHVALDAPRRQREVVAWNKALLAELRGLELPVGLTLERTLLKLDLAAEPHLLVAGTTGSGKSIFLKCALLSLLQRLSPEQCQVAIIDPKMVDFAPFNQFQLYRPVIYDAGEAVALLQTLVDDEMPRRTALLRSAGVANRLELPASAAPMPALVVVIDEFADLLAQFPERAARAQFLLGVQRLLQRARAVGIHLVIATQRPSVDAVPGQLKANLPVRLAFKLPQAHDSVTVLDEAGAESLLGRGDLLLKRDGTITRAQGFLITAADLA